MASASAHPPSLATGQVCRQPPKVRARCGNSARRDPRGGYAVTRIPTAIRLAALAAAAWALMIALYAPTLRAYGRPWLEAFGLPVAAALYTAMTFDSALADARGIGGAWKGRTYRAEAPKPV